MREKEEWKRWKKKGMKENKCESRRYRKRKLIDKKGRESNYRSYLREIRVRKMMTDKVTDGRKEWKNDKEG